jgi:hypothetical protein
MSDINRLPPICEACEQRGVLSILPCSGGAMGEVYFCVGCTVEHRRQCDACLELQILRALQERPGLDLGQISGITGIKRGPSDNPLASRLNQTLKSLRDNGEIRTNNQWGDPRFFLTSEVKA